MDEITKILDIAPADIFSPTDVKEKVLPIITEEPEDEDYDYVRSNYYEIIQQGQMALAGALRIASLSENPRAYEVVGALLKNLADVNRQLLQTGEDKQKVKAARKGNVGQQPQQVTNNNTAVFVGNSADLNKMLKKTPE
jgi:hypothetical protein